MTHPYLGGKIDSELSEKGCIEGFPQNAITKLDRHRKMVQEQNFYTDTSSKGQIWVERSKIVCIFNGC